ncbi:MAG TPA: ABC transporter permease [Actinomycetota bacterium]|nr:ABC transporter permease [Actinomycetota bacterium]
MSLYTDVIRYPDLFMNIFRRELYGKYRGSVLGLVWTLINPLALMAVYTLVFSVLLKAFQIEHYPLFVLSGLLTWVFFQSAVQMSCSSLFGQPTLVKQVQFPRQMLPLAVVATNVVTLAAMLAVVLAVNLIFVPDMRTTFWAALPLLVLLMALVSGLAVVFGYLTVVYRDIEHLMNTIFLPWFFLTPVFYLLDQLPGLEGREWVADVLYYVNFVTPFVEAIRDPLFFGSLPQPGDIIYCVVASLAALALGVLVARRFEDQVGATL